MPPALALAAGALAALVLAVPLARRAPGLVHGVGLVLLLVAVLRSLGDAASYATWDADGEVRPVLAVAAGIVVGVAARALAGRRDALRGPVAVAAVALAHVPVLSSFGTGGGLSAFGTAAPDTTVLVLAGLLAGGAVAAVRPAPLSAGAAVAGLVVVLALAGPVEPVLLPAAAAGVAVPVLVPLLVEAAGRALREHEGPRLGQGLLAGVLLVLGVAAVQPYLDPPEERYAGSGLLTSTDDEHVTPGAYDVLLVPGFGLLQRPVITYEVIYGG